jgi:hypothetical protein
VLYDKQIARMLPHRSGDLRCRFTGSHLAMRSAVRGARPRQLLPMPRPATLDCVHAPVLLDVILLCIEHSHDGQQQQFSTNFPAIDPASFPARNDGAE